MKKIWLQNLINKSFNLVSFYLSARSIQYELPNKLKDSVFMYMSSKREILSSKPICFPLS